jgi:hypothetical protein
MSKQEHQRSRKIVFPDWRVVHPREDGLKCEALRIRREAEPPVHERLGDAAGLVAAGLAGRPGSGQPRLGGLPLIGAFNSPIIDSS